MSSVLSELMVVVALLAILLAVHEIGFRSGRRAADRPGAPSAALVGPAQGAMLGLLGLLLGFSFAGAAGRFMDRQDLIVQEANAIGTAYLRAGLLDEPHRTQLRGHLKEYLAYRVEVSKTLHGTLDQSILTKVAEMQNAIWSATRDGVNAKPETMKVLLDPINEVLDLHTARIAAGRKHLPLPLLVLLVICALLALSMMGYGSGLGKHRTFVVSSALAFLIASALWLTVDLDHARKGIIQLSDKPLQELNLSSLP